MYSIVPCAASERGEGAAFHRRPRPQCWSYGASLWGLGVPHLPGRVPENQVGEALHLEAPQRKERVLRAARSPVREPGMEWKVGSFGATRSIALVGPALPPSPHPLRPPLCRAQPPIKQPLSPAIHSPSRTFPLRGQEGSRDLFGAACRSLVPGSVMPEPREI